MLFKLKSLHKGNSNLLKKLLAKANRSGRPTAPPPLESDTVFHRHYCNFALISLILRRLNRHSQRKCAATALSLEVSPLNEPESI